MSEVKEEVSIDQLSQEDYNKARDKGESTVEKPVEAEPEHKEDKPKPKGGFQTRIDRLIREKDELAQELERARAAKGTDKVEPAKAAPVVEAEPKIEDFTDHNEYIKAMAKFIARETLRTEREEQTKKEQEAARKSEFDAYNEKTVNARVKYEDWEEVVGNPKVLIPPSVHVAIIEMENGPDVAYYLGKHPELAKELMEMSPSRANGKIWRLSEQLEAESPAEEEETEEIEVDPEPEKPKVKVEAKPEKKKYEPIKPVGGGSSKSSVPLDQMSMADYNKAREAGRVR